jgi:hypothetical protein
MLCKASEAGVLLHWILFLLLGALLPKVAVAQSARNGTWLHSACLAF